MRFLQITLLALSATFAVAESAKEISARFAKDKAKALEAYLAANPAASDAFEAQQMLINSYLECNDAEQAIKQLNEQYKSIPKGKDGVLQAGAENFIQREKLYLATNRKDLGQKALVEFQNDFQAHPQFGQASQMLAQVASAVFQPSIGDTMEIAFTAIDGRKVDLAALKGKVVLVDFWATWCGPCVAEIPNVLAAYEKYHDKGFEVIGISRDQDMDALKHFVAEKKVPWPMHFDTDPKGPNFGDKYGAFTLPTIFLVGKDGKVVASAVRGPILEQKLAELLK